MQTTRLRPRKGKRQDRYIGKSSRACREGHEDKVIKAGKKGRAGTSSTTRRTRCSGRLRICRTLAATMVNCVPAVRTGSFCYPAVLQRSARAREPPPRLRLRSYHGCRSRFLVLQHSIYGGGGPAVSTVTTSLHVTQRCR